MRSLTFEGNTWIVYEQIREKDKKLHKALCKLLKETLRSDPASGLGKPEPLNVHPELLPGAAFSKLKHNSDLWSKRISQKDRLIYKFDDNYIYIFATSGHYEQL